MARAWVCTCWSCWTRRCSCGRSTGVAARQSSANASACCLCCSVIDIDSAARAPPTSSAGNCSAASCASSWSDGYGSARGTKAATALSIDSIGRQRSDVCPTLIESHGLSLYASDARLGSERRLSLRYVPNVEPTSRMYSAPPCTSITAWLCDTSQSCSSEMQHLRERPISPPACPTGKTRSEYGPDVVRK